MAKHFNALHLLRKFRSYQAVLAHEFLRVFKELGIKSEEIRGKRILLKLNRWRPTCKHHL